MSIDSVRDGALALPEPERAELAADLLASLGPPVPKRDAAARAAWSEELTRRAERALSGEEPGELWSDVERRLREELNG